MSSIKKLTQGIEELTIFIDKYKKLSQEDPNNFSHKLTLQSLESQISELQQQLHRENLKREKEIIQLRLKGGVTEFGTFPLSLVGGITNSFYKLVFNASKYFEYGDKGGDKIKRIINDKIDLRLENLGLGSTIFYLSAKTSPDMFGNSIIQKSLDNVFGLLNSEYQDRIIENIPVVGSESIKYLSCFLKELDKNDLELDLTWHTPDETIKKWDGTKKKISSIYNNLNNIQLSKPKKIKLEGTIITLSLKGKFEIYSDNKRYEGKYPNELTEKIKQLHVGNSCKCVISQTTIFNQATDKKKYEFSLIEI